VTPKQREIAVHTISKALFIGANYKFGDGDVTHCFKEAEKWFEKLLDEKPIKK